MMTKRVVARKLRETKNAINISSLLGVILAMASLIIAFISTFPNSSFGNGEKVNPYIVMNTSLLIMAVIIISYIAYIALWFYVKDSPPLIDINDYFLHNSAYIRLKNNEPVDLDYIQIRMGGLALDNMENGLGWLGHNNLLKIEQRIVNGEKIDIPIANGKNGYTHFSVDDGLYNLSLRNRKEKEPYGTYRIALEIFVHPVDEQKAMLVGRYFGIIYHKVNGKEFSNNQENQDVVGWEKDSFKKISEKDYLAFVTVRPLH